MTVYLDVVFFVNLLYQFGILTVTDILFSMHAPKWRILIAAMLGSGGYCLCIVAGVPVNLFPGNLMAGILIGISSILAAFYPVKGRKFGCLAVTVLFLSICLGGVLELIPGMERERYQLLMASGAMIFTGLFCIKVKKLLFEISRDKGSIRKVRLFHEGNMTEAYGLVDTGNHLMDPISKEPVIILQKEVKDKLLAGKEVKEQKGYRMIPYGSIGTKKGVLEAFRLERMEIAEREEEDEKEAEWEGAIVRLRVICAVYEENYSMNEKYGIILHPYLL